MKNLKKYFAFVLLSGVMLSACEKNLEVEGEKPTGKLTPEDAIKTAQDLQYMLNSCYDNCGNMMDGRFQFGADLMADDITAPLNAEPFRTGIYNRRSNPFNSYSGDLFSQPYFTINRCNSLALYYDQVSGLSATERTRLQAEALFLRALCHFETLKLFAQPAGFTPDNSHLGIILRERAKNEPLPRSSVAASYALIIKDLEQAIAGLPASASVKVYANKYAAQAMLAKVYFQMGRYSEAIGLLNQVIPAYTLSDSLNRFKFAETQSEMIFCFAAPNNASTNPYEASGVRSAEYRLQYRSDLGRPNIGLTAEAYALLSDTTDRRRNLFNVLNLGTGQQIIAFTKFNQNNFGTPYLHLTDMILMRAEALMLSGGSQAQALADVNLIIARAYGAGSPRMLDNTMTNADILENIRIQRRIEMFGEGDRLHQIKRMRDNAKLVRGAPWNCPGMVLQYPSSCGTSALFVFNPTATCN